MINFCKSIWHIRWECYTSNRLLDPGDSLVRYIYHGSYRNLVHILFLVLDCMVLPWTDSFSTHSFTRSLFLITSLVRLGDGPKMTEEVMQSRFSSELSMPWFIQNATPQDTTNKYLQRTLWALTQSIKTLWDMPMSSSFRCSQCSQ